MDSRLLWFLVGAGAVYLLSKSNGGAGLGGGFTISVGGNVGAQVPPDQRWQQPTTRERIGTWDPMGTPTFYKDAVEGSSGNKVNSGGGFNA